MAALATRYTGQKGEGDLEYAAFLEELQYVLKFGEWNMGQYKHSRKQKSKVYRPMGCRGSELDIDTFEDCLHRLEGEADTVLHLAVSACKCAEDSKAGYKDSKAGYKETIDGLVIFILRKKAVLNARNRNGRTALMMAAQNGCLHIVKVLVDWTNEHDGVKVDLNAEDIYGETALFKAVLYSRVEVVEFLIRRGALDIYDNRGFSALHAAVCGPRENNGKTLFAEFFGDFCWLTFIKSSSNTSTNTSIFYAHCLEQLESLRSSSEDTFTRDIVKLIDVGLLLQNYPKSLTAKDLRGNTALDWAAWSKTQISELTIRKPKELTQLDKQMNPEELLGIDDWGRTSFHRLAVISSDTKIMLPDLLIKSNIKDTHLEPFIKKLCGKDKKGRTALHYAAMSSRGNLSDIIELGCSVNETDVNGRTPLHYAKEKVYDLLLTQYGADETTKDVDEKTPLDLKQLRQNEKSVSEEECEEPIIDSDYGVRLLSNDGSISEKLDTWQIWTMFKFAYRDPFSEWLKERMKHLFERLAEEIGKKDRRFECRPVLVGSAYEGTRVGFMDEFDFDFVLIKFGECCHVFPAPEAPVGFVRLRKLNLNGRYSQDELDFDEFFNDNDVLMSNKVSSRFRCLYSEVLKQPHVWESEPYFEWDIHNEFGVSFIPEAYGMKTNRFRAQDDLKASRNLYTNIVLRLNRPINDRYMFKEISVDIVPCIRVAGWWPDGTLSTVSNDLRAEGCYLVFDQPQRKYPWVPYSTDPYVRISFAVAESRIVNESSALAKAAYMVVKRMVSVESEYKFTHVWKNSLFYCLEAMNDENNKNMKYEQINKEDLRLFVEKLTLCFFELCRQDFCPCYLMPSFSLPINDEMKSNHRRLPGDYNNKGAYMLYQSVCEGIPEIKFREPDHKDMQPLFEKFDKDELMRKLVKIQNLENIVGQPSESSERTLDLKRSTTSMELPESKRQKLDRSITREDL